MAKATAEAKAKTLFTIGYEQSTATAFFDALTRAKVGLLVDVRAVAASRRPGFSKRQLAAGLDEHGIGFCICKSSALRRRDGLRRAAGMRTGCYVFSSAILRPRRCSTSLMN